MKTALIALDPMIQTHRRFDGFCDTVKWFQEQKLISHCAIASVVQPALYAIPSIAYDGLKGTFQKEGREHLERACKGRFNFDEIRMLISDSAAKENHIAQLERCANRLERDMLVLGSHDRRGLPLWALGSYAETAALTAKLPVLVIKSPSTPVTFAHEPRLLVAVDPASPPSNSALKWIADFAKPGSASVELLYVEPKERLWAGSLREKRNLKDAADTLKKLQQSLGKLKINATIKLLEESSKSVAQTIVDQADHLKAWMTITTAPERSPTQRLLLGSTARRVLSLSKRPFLSLRMA